LEIDVKTIVIRVGIALVLGAGAWMCWREATIVDRAADSRLALSLLQYDAIDGGSPGWTLSDVVLNGARPLAGEARRDLAVADYWSGRYADAMEVGRQEIDPDLLLIAANASFRTSQREGHSGQAAVQRLDGVLQAYASVLKAEPRQADAAYNYELVARVRDAVAGAAAAKTRPETPLAAAPAPRVPAGDLPSGPTLHGHPGAPPPEVKAEDFQIIAPMEFGDREAQPEPTPGGKLPRKG
jgi:hypothetical protein